VRLASPGRRAIFDDDHDAFRDSVRRFVATDVVSDLADWRRHGGMQFHGGYGYTREYPTSAAFADARFLRLAALAHSDVRHAVAAGIGLSQHSRGR
jgi:hypothetical protein